MAAQRQPRAAKEKPVVPPLVAAVRQAILPGRGAPCAVATAREAAGAIMAAAVLCLSKGAIGRDVLAELDTAKGAEAAIAFSLDPEAAALIITSRGKRPVRELLVRTARSGLGTHGGKMPDARFGIGAMVPDPGASAASRLAPGLHSGSADLAFRLSGADAQMTSALRFLGAPISVGGAPPVQIVELLGQADGPVLADLQVAMGPAASAVLSDAGSAARARLQAGAVPSDISVHRKQVLFPIGDGGYVALSPLYSYGLAAEISRRIRARQSREMGEGRQFFSTRVVHVGGTKPQNAGLLPNFLGGEMPRLLAMPPNPEAGTRDQVLRRLRMGTIPLPATVMRKEALDGLCRAMGSQSDNQRARRGIEAALRRMVDDTLWAVSKLAELQVSADASGEVIIAEKDVPQQNRLAGRLAGMLPGKVHEADLEPIVGKIAAFICARLRGKTYSTPLGQQTFAPGDGAHAYVSHVAMGALKEFR